MESEFAHEIDGAFALLQDVTGTLNQCRVDFVVVGGWVTYLFHQNHFGHPGTYDADILLNAQSLDDGTFASATDKLLSKGCLRAVKNRFQLHRVIRVKGEDLVFHSDFLNERNPDDELNLVTMTGKIGSIYTPAMEAVFKFANYREHPDLPGVRFPSVEAFIATKAMAATARKRVRDAFDVFISVADKDPSEFRLHWQTLVHDRLFLTANNVLWHAVNGGDAIEKITSILDGLSPKDRPSEKEIRQRFEFLLEPTD